MSEPEPAVASTTRARPTTGVVGAGLIGLGLVLWLLYRLTIGGEPHSYAAGATPPSDVALTRGQQYSIGIPGGVDVVRQRLADPDAVSCTITPAGGQRAQLAVTPEASDRASNEVATFVSPVSGRARVTCPGLPAVFVDDADDAGVDLADVALVLASIMLAVGVPLAFSAARRTISGSPRTESV